MPTKAINLKPLMFKDSAYTDNDDPNVLRAPPITTPFNEGVNPFQTGLQMGAMGAAAGLGLAGIQRALRLRAGDQTPTSMYKPMVIGAVIGAALGGYGGYKAKKYIEKNQPYPPPTTWDELGTRLEENSELNKYGGLTLIVKRAQEAAAEPAAGGSVGKELARAGLYFVPGVGTVMSGYDALKNIGGMGKNLLQGNFRGAGKELLGGIGNTAMALASLFPFAGGLIRGGVKGVGAINRITRGAGAIKNIRNIGRMGSLVPGSADAIAAAQYGAGRLGGMWRGLSPAMSKINPAYIAKMEQLGSKVQPLGNHLGKLQLAGLANMAGVFGGGAASGGAPQMPNPSRYRGSGFPGHGSSPYAASMGGGNDAYGIAKPTLFSNAGMPKFEVPDVDY